MVTYKILMHQIIKNILENNLTRKLLKKYFLIFYLWKLYFVHRPLS